MSRRPTFFWRESIYFAMYESNNATFYAVAVLGKNIWGAWPLIIWEATTAKRNLL